jgi:hypothetical protein
MHTILLYTGAALPLVWGIAHLIPARSVIHGFGPISEDSRRIIVMEWIGEGLTLIFLGCLVFCVTWIDSTHAVSRIVYWLAFFMLNSMSIVSLFTGFRVGFLPFKLCPLIFTSSSILILLGGCLPV